MSLDEALPSSLFSISTDNATWFPESFLSLFLWALLISLYFSATEVTKLNGTLMQFIKGIYKEGYHPCVPECHDSLPAQIKVTVNFYMLFEASARSFQWMTKRLLLEEKSPKLIRLRQKIVKEMESIQQSLQNLFFSRSFFLFFRRNLGLELDFCKDHLR